LGGYNKPIQDKFLKCKGLDSTLNLLQLLFDLRKNQTGEKKGNNLLNEIFEKESRFEVFTTILRLISNMVHIHEEAQNFLVEKKCIILLLNFTNLDDDNPLCREWSVVLIKNLTESI
jgi:hypothetical protein